MLNFLNHKSDILQDYVDCNYNQYLQEAWGIKTACRTSSVELAWFKEKLLSIQTLEDCGNLCFDVDDTIINSYAAGTEISLFPPIS